MNLRQLMERRARLINEARAIVDGAEAEDRGLNEDEETRYDLLMNDANDLGERIQRAQAQQLLEDELGQSSELAARPDPEDVGDAGERDSLPEFESRSLRNFARQEPEFYETPEWRRLTQFVGPEYQNAFRSWMRTRPHEAEELRALQAASDTAGGYLVVPMQFVDRLIQAVDNMVFIRQWATVFPVPDAGSLGAPSLDNDPADPAWTSELLIGSEDSTMSFGRRELAPHPLAKYIKVSRKLLRMVPDVEGLVVQRLGYKFAVTAENAYLNGDGSGEPLGVFVASAQGIDTDRDASTGNTTTAIQFDGLIEAKYTLKQQYWPRARWMFHRDGVKQIAKLKDGNGQYLWRESVRVGEPDRMLGFGVFMSEYAPNTFTTGLYVGILGDFANYWIADALDLEMQRLVELYAATNQVGFIGRLESDGMPVLSEAFVRVTLA